MTTYPHRKLTDYEKTKRNRARHHAKLALASMSESNLRAAKGYHPAAALYAYYARRNATECAHELFKAHPELREGMREDDQRRIGRKIANLCERRHLDYINKGILTETSDEMLNATEPKYRVCNRCRRKIVWSTAGWLTKDGEAWCAGTLLDHSVTLEDPEPIDE